LIRITWYILIALNLTAYISRAQPNGLSVYQFPKQIPQSYRFNVEAELAKMAYSTPADLKQSDYEYFTHTIIENRIYQINEGEIYLEWSEAELYLKRLLNQLLPDSLKNKKNINIYIRRDSTPNAYSSYDASIYINMGLLADIKSEAALAFVIGHELAHYVGQHQLHNYQLFKQNHKNEEKKLKRLVHTNKLLELEADEVAAQIIRQAGFNVSDVYSVFDLIYSDENFFKKERVENVKKIINQYQEEPGLDDSRLFKKVNQLAKYEKVQLLLNQFEHNECLKNALYYYINDTTLHFLPYYIVEATRKHLLLYPNDLNEAVFDFSKQQELGMPNMENTEKNTYKNLIEYFLTPQFLERIPDLVFSKALFAYQMDMPEANEMFEKYLKLTTTRQYADLAKYLNTRYENAPKKFNKSVAIIENISAYNLKEPNKPVIDVNKSFFLNNKLNTKLKENLSSKFPKQSIILQRDLSKNNYQKTTFYKQLSVAALLAQNIEEANNLPVCEILFLLFPKAFNVLQKEQIDEISLFKVNTFKKNNKRKFTGVINPLNWIAKAFRSYVSGSTKQFYTIEQINLNQSSGIIFYDVDTIKYKLNLPHLLNSIYESIKNTEICYEELVEN